MTLSTFSECTTTTSILADPWWYVLTYAHYAKSVPLLKIPRTAISCKANFEKAFRGRNTDSRRDQSLGMKGRLQRSCKRLIHVGDAEDLPTAETSHLHRTVKEFIIDVKTDHTVARADQRLYQRPSHFLAGDVFTASED